MNNHSLDMCFNKASLINVVILTAKHRESCNSNPVAPLFFFPKNEGILFYKERICIIKGWGAGENN